MNKLTIKDLDLKGKRVLMRVDFNVPLDDKLNITDDTRIRATLPTIKYALDKGAKLILMSHLGRPDGKVIAKYSLAPCAAKLSQLLGKPVKMAKDCVGPDVKAMADAMKPGECILLENLRFHAEEEANDANFAKELASLGDVFVNDAFGTAHRAHASTEGVTKYLKSAAGFLLEKEIEYLEDKVMNPAKPFVTILGGAKVSDKIGVIENLLDKADSILIGGGMAYTFYAAQGKSIGASKVEKDKIDIAKLLLEKAKQKKVNIVLPVDNIIADKFDANANTKVVGDQIPDGWMGLDVGPKTVEVFKNVLKSARTIVWNGPLGVFEMDKFSKGTEEVAKYIACLSGGCSCCGGSKVISIIGGGDTAAAIAKFKLEDKMTHISTGGGASLEYLEGKVLPGIKALTDK
ncbi:MAG: phosphoglycerate kinase [Candidatus Omnitrophica bacterium]|nr:phosphoglycerate kinase [Candidatus Omnitrophota bacterium]